MVFLLQSGASSLRSNIPTDTMITPLFNVRNHDQQNTSKTLTFANQSEVPIKQYISNLCLIKRNKPKFLLIPVAVVDFWNIFLRKPLFEEYIQNITIRDFTWSANLPSIINPQLLLLPLWLRRFFPSLLNLPKRISKNQPVLNPILYRYYAFRRKSWKHFCLRLKIKNHLLLKSFRRSFCQNWNTGFL